MAIPVPATAQKILSILSIDVKTRPPTPLVLSLSKAPSPLMGEGWGEGEIRNAPSFRRDHPLMVSLSNHMAISLRLNTRRQTTMLKRRDSHPRIKYGVAMTG